MVGTMRIQKFGEWRFAIEECENLVWRASKEILSQSHHQFPPTCELLECMLLTLNLLTTPLRAHAPLFTLVCGTHNGPFRAIVPRRAFYWCYSSILSTVGPLRAF